MFQPKVLILPILKDFLKNVIPTTGAKIVLFLSIVLAGFLFSCHGALHARIAASPFVADITLLADWIIAASITFVLMTGSWWSLFFVVQENGRLKEMHRVLQSQNQTLQKENKTLQETNQTLQAEKEELERRGRDRNWGGVPKMRFLDPDW